MGICSSYELNRSKRRNDSSEQVINELAVCDGKILNILGHYESEIKALNQSLEHLIQSNLSLEEKVRSLQNNRLDSNVQPRRESPSNASVLMIQLLCQLERKRKKSVFSVLKAVIPSDRSSEETEGTVTEARIQKKPSILQTFYHSQSHQEKPMPISELYRRINSLMEEKMHADSVDIELGRNIKAFPDFTYDFFIRSYGLKGLAHKALCQFITSIERLYMDGNETGLLMCKLLHIIDVDPIPDQLTVFLIRARSEFIKLVSRHDQALGMTDAINLIYSLFETDKFSRATCIRLIKPDDLPLDKFLIFRICHKLCKVGDSPEAFFYSCGEEEGLISSLEMVKRIKILLEYAISPEDIECLLNLLDRNRLGVVEKDHFLDHVNVYYFKQWHKKIFAEKFLLAVHETYKRMKAKDIEIIYDIARNFPDQLNSAMFRALLLKTDPYLNDEIVDFYFAKISFDNQVVYKDDFAQLAINYGIGGLGERDFCIHKKNYLGYIESCESEESPRRKKRYSARKYSDLNFLKDQH